LYDGHHLAPACSEKRCGTKFWADTPAWAYPSWRCDDNLAAAEAPLSADDEMSAIPLGFPHDMLAVPATKNRIAGGKRTLLDLPAAPVR
jgi:hypothetical protein